MSPKYSKNCESEKLYSCSEVYRTEALYQLDPVVMLRLATSISHKHRCLNHRLLLGVVPTGYYLHRLK